MREQNAFTQAQLGKILKKSPSAVRMWELGKNEPDLETLSALADIFECPLDYLCCRGDSEKKHNPNDIPLYAGNASADKPESYLPLPQGLQGDGHEYFAVRCRTNDMAPSLLPGDIVILRRQDSCLNNQTVLLRADNGREAFRRVVYRRDGVILLPLNTDYEPDFIPCEKSGDAFSVLGLVTEIRRALI